MKFPGASEDAERQTLLARLYLRQTLLSLIASAGAFVAVAVLIVGKLPYALGYVWTAMMAAFLARDLWRRRKRRKKRFSLGAASRVLHNAPIFAAVYGALWGGLVFALPYLGESARILLTFIVFALAASATSTLSAAPRAAMGFILMSSGPFLVAYLLQPTGVSNFIALLGLGFMGVMVLSLHFQHQGLRAEMKAREDAYLARRDMTDARAEVAAIEQRWSEFSRSAEALALYDENGRILLWNEPYREFLDVPPEALRRGATFADIREKEEELLAEHRFIEQRAPVPDDFMVVTQRNGRWYRSATQVLSNGHIAITHVDITDLKDTESTLLALRDTLVGERDRAEAANRAKTNFLAKMSHELRTPLNAVIGFSDLIVQDNERGRRDHERHTGYARLISDSGRHLLAIVDDLLDLTRIESGQMALRESEFDLGDAVRSARLLVQGRYEEQSVRFIEHFPQRPVMLWGDRRLIRQAVLNLIENAVKFSGDDAVVDICVDSLANGKATVTVSDNGIGIPENLRDQIMRPFAQVEGQETRKYGGVGLGLSLVREFAELHGGAVELEENVQGGLKVILTLPAERKMAA